MPALRAWMVWGVLGVAAVLAHGLVLLDDGFYHDGWVLHRLVRLGQWDTLRAWRMSVNDLLDVWVLLPMLRVGLAWGLDESGLFNGATLLLQLLSARVLTAVCRASGWLTPRQGLLVGLLWLVVPVSPVFDFGRFYLDVTFYLLAVLCALRAAGVVGARYWGWRGLALWLFWLGFHLNSFLVFHGVFLVVLVAARWRREGGIGLGWLSRQWDYAALPFAYWAVRAWLVATGRYDPTYNPVRLDIADAWLVYREWGRTLALTGATWAPPLLVAGAVAAGLVWIGRSWVPEEPGSRRMGLIVAGLGLVACCVGLLPYALVGKGLGPPGAHFAARSALLQVLGLAVAGAGALIWLCGGLTRPAWVLVGALCGAGTWEWWHVYAHWQANTVKWKGVCQALARSADVGRSTLVLLEDRYPVGMHDPVDGWETGRVITPPWYGVVRTLGPLTTSLQVFVDLCSPHPTGVWGWMRPEVRDDDVRGEVSSELISGTARVLASAKGADAAEAWRRRLRGLDRARLRAAIAAELPAIEAGVRMLDVTNAPRAVLARRELVFAGFPWIPMSEPQPAFRPAGLWPRPSRTGFAPVEIYPPRPRRIEHPVHVVVRPGPVGTAVPVDSSWRAVLQGRWREPARRLWWGYQYRRFFDPASLPAYLDQVVQVEIRSLAR